jgi:hypothetical protein
MVWNPAEFEQDRDQRENKSHSIDSLIVASGFCSIRTGGPGKNIAGCHKGDAAIFIQGGRRCLAGLVDE